MEAMAGNMRVAITVEEDESTVVIGDAKIEVAADGKKVTAYSDAGVEINQAEAPKTQGTHFSVTKDFNTIVLNGVTIRHAADGHLVIWAPGTLMTKPAPANDATPSQAPKPGEVSRRIRASRCMRRRSMRR